ncbi:MAG: hypothetical protein D3910_02010 [Candidatus Electrothrix sp. ATG2]|nr:hypothetical protein [Candidatus Electrothrix sp. ATG2]
MFFFIVREQKKSVPILKHHLRDNFTQAENNGYISGKKRPKDRLEGRKAVYFIQLVRMSPFNSVIFHSLLLRKFCNTSLGHYSGSGKGWKNPNPTAAQPGKRRATGRR